MLPAFCYALAEQARKLIFSPRAPESIKKLKFKLVHLSLVRHSSPSQVYKHITINQFNLYTIKSTKLILYSTFNNAACYASLRIWTNCFLDGDKDKITLLDTTKNKSGIYMWTNKLNGKNFIGSSVNIWRRLLE